MSEKGQDEIAADYEAQQIGTHIAHKIYELNNPSNRNKEKHKKVVSAQVCENTNDCENTCHNINDPKDNMPNNVSSASSSHSIIEVNNNVSKEHVTFSDKENDEIGSTISSTIQGISNTSIDDTDESD